MIPTGSLTLDRALGWWISRGRVVEIYGQAFGKTTLTLHAIAECQKAGGVAAFMMHILDTVYAHLGVKVDELLISQPILVNKR